MFGFSDLTPYFCVDDLVFSMANQHRKIYSFNNNHVRVDRASDRAPVLPP